MRKAHSKLREYRNQQIWYSKQELSSIFGKNFAFNQHIAGRTSKVLFANFCRTKGLFDTTDDIHTLVNQSLDSDLPAAPQLFHTIEESLTYLRNKIFPDGCQNNTRPCVRRSNGQTGIDNGGLSRQFFTDFFLAASAGANGILALLKGWNGQTLIAYNPTIYSCDVTKTFGKSWHIQQCRLAWFCLALVLSLFCLVFAIYYYICTGKIKISVTYLTIAEVPCQETKEYFTQVRAIYFSFHKFYAKYLR